MPVAKKKVDAPEIPLHMATPTEDPHTDHGCMGGRCMPHHGMMHGKSHCGHFARKLILTFFGILLVYTIVYVGVKIQNEIKAYEYIGVADKAERMITIEAEASVDVAPNIATVQMGLTTQAPTVAEAQTKNTEIMNKFIAQVKELEIAPEDIQTSNYDVYPKYDWTQAQGQELVGYEVSQNVGIKIRNLDVSKQVVALAGEAGITNVGNLEYTIDEKDAYLAQAREEALQKVSEKAGVLSRALGIRMKEVIGYTEYEVGMGDEYYYGKGMMADAGAGVPDLQSGTNTVSLHVSVAFELK
ncbi:MAG: SIMPL domain-containing protein [Candidatus Magasanikbacteria bacterium]|nr:SIMPL domain-containing protein [Candidatus Magasanikbacteria bacterium]